MDNNATPAFPVLDAPPDCTGLSKREYAAIHIMPAIIEKFHGYDSTIIANMTMKCVDALFDRLEK